MEYLVLGFFTGLSLILAIGAQNIFVIEQGLKKQHIFLVCFVCSISDLFLIFLGIFLFHYFIQYFNNTIELIFNILLVVFLIHFIYSKIKLLNSKINFNNDVQDYTRFNVFLKTLGFTYLNPHVYSDTVFFLGNFSKNFILQQKILFYMTQNFFIKKHHYDVIGKIVDKKITEMWSIINRRNSYNESHIHPNNFLSSVYYVEAPKDSGSIIFNNPNQVSRNRYPLDIKKTEFSANLQKIEPKEGTLLLFPSYLWHSVEENKSDEDRVIISFNIDILR